MAKVISILNYKGGVAKTTTTANLGTALWILGKKVLLVDTDTQCDLSTQLGYSQSSEDNTLHEWLLKDCDPPVYDRYDGLHYIPSKKDDEFIEKLSKVYHPEDSLSDHLNTIKDYFDYILIDCMPSDNLINVNAKTASDSILIPLECDTFAVQGLHSLLDSIEKTKKRSNKALEIEGMLITSYDKQLKISKSSLAYLEEEFPNKIFQTKIRKNVRFCESPMENKTCFEYEIKANGAEDYISLAEELTGESRPQDWKQKILKAWLSIPGNENDENVIEQLKELNK